MSAIHKLAIRAAAVHRRALPATIPQYALLTMLALAGALSCGDSSTEPTEVPAPVATTVTVSPAAASLTALGDTARLTVEVRDQNGSPMADASVTWASSDAAVAMVDDGGLVRGVGEGGTTITAAAGDARGTARIAVTNPDRAALVALYNATDGPNWVNNENWLTDAPLHEWFGVDTDDSARVIELNLHRNEMSGPIPPEIGNLSNLQRLSLSENQLTGPIPPEIGNLSNLQGLWSHGNQLTGPIPPEIGNLSTLYWLALNSNQLTGPIPPEIGGLSRLLNLTLSYNDLTDALPHELGNLSNLFLLRLNGNQLTGSIPSELGNLSNLQTLVLSSNQLTGPIPPELGNLSNLEDLAVNGNVHLEGTLPSSLINLEGLARFWFHDTGLCAPSGSFRAWLEAVERRSDSRQDTVQGNYCGVDAAPTDAAPTVVIQVPTTESSISIVDSRVTLAGVAFHSQTITSVAWSIPNGTSGPAQGTENWNAGPIPVDLGSTQVIVTATDTIGNQGSDTLQVIRNAAVRFPGPPQFDPDILAVSTSSPSFGIQVAVEPSDGFELTDVVLAQVDEQGADLDVRIPLSDDDGDGVYSGSHTIAPPPTEPGFRYYRAVARGQLDGTLVQDESAVAALEIVEPTTAAEVDNVIEVQALALDSAGKVLASTADMSAAILAADDLLRNHPDVAGVERTGATSISLTYTSGLIGGIVFAYADDSGAITTRGAHTTVSTNANPPAWHGHYEEVMPSTADNLFPATRQSVMAGHRASLSGVQLAASDSNFVRSHRAVIYEPFAHEWEKSNSAEGDSITRLLEGANSGVGMRVRRFKNEAATVNAFAQMMNYGLVVIATHGSGGKLIMTSEKVTPESSERYGVQAKARRLGVVTRAVFDSSDVRELDNNWAITDGFVARLTGRFPRSIVINNSCQSTKTDLLARAFLEKGAKTYFGYDEDVDSYFAYTQAIRIVTALDDGLTADQAFAGGGKDPWYCKGKQGCTPASFQKRGNGMMRFAKERAALVALYEATNGAGWTRNHNWRTDRPLHIWDGVGVDDDGRVVRLDLPHNNLSGILPPELGWLSNLRWLSLPGNQLTESIPPELGELLQLEYLALGLNKLTGPIPPALGQLSNLRSLSLYSHGPADPTNQLTGPIPSELGRLSQLESLNLKGNQLLTGPIPPELGQLSNLRSLGLGGNKLTGSIPPELGRLSNLRRLGLSYNQLTGSIPPELMQLQQLEQFTYVVNDGLCLPPTDSFLEWMNGVVERSGLTGSFRGSHGGPLCGEIEALRALYDATGGPNWERNDGWFDGTGRPYDRRLGHWHGVRTNNAGWVTEIRLSDNALTGSIPPELEQLSQLDTLNLGSNQLTGSIPPELGQLSNLLSLSLYDNQLTGSIPPELGQLSNLLSLRLGINQLTGPIPPELGQLSNLGVLYLNHNYLSGEPPPELMQLQIAFSYAVNNGVCLPPTGRFNEWVNGIVERGGGIWGPRCGEMEALRALYDATGGPNWERNVGWFDGTGRPSNEWLGHWSGVSINNKKGWVDEIYLQNNGLTGSIPALLGELSQLKELHLAYNQLTGSIPASLGELSQLKELNLFRNQLTGSIPPELGQLSQVTRGILSVNRLSGCIPPLGPGEWIVDYQLRWDAASQRWVGYQLQPC